jgi:hypothetical protein
MISTGNRSYYDDYVRKAGIKSKGLSEPPALLTDRGAYLNYLEVNLERLSSACMTVQAYESRFGDMQGLIAALEARCANTTKLVSLTKQCTEEVREEADQKIARALATVQINKSDSEHVLQEASKKVAVLEEHVSGVNKRAEALEDRAVASEEAANAEKKDSEVALQKLMDRMNEIDTNSRLAAMKAESCQAQLARHNSFLDDLRDQINSRMSQLETKVDKEGAALKDEISRKLQSADSKSTTRDDELRDQVRRQVDGLKAAIRQGSEEGMDQIIAVKKMCNEMLSVSNKKNKELAAMATSHDDISRQMFKLRHKVAGLNSTLKSKGTRFRNKVSHLSKHQSELYQLVFKLTELEKSNNISTLAQSSTTEGRGDPGRGEPTGSNSAFSSPSRSCVTGNSDGAQESQKSTGHFQKAFTSYQKELEDIQGRLQSLIESESSSEAEGGEGEGEGSANIDRAAMYEALKGIRKLNASPRSKARASAPIEAVLAQQERHGPYEGRSIAVPGRARRKTKKNFIQPFFSRLPKHSSPWLPAYVSIHFVLSSSHAPNHSVIDFSP